MSKIQPISCLFVLGEIGFPEYEILVLNWAVKSAKMLCYDTIILIKYILLEDLKNNLSYPHDVK